MVAVSSFKANSDDATLSFLRSGNTSWSGSAKEGYWNAQGLMIFLPTSWSGEAVTGGIMTDSFCFLVDEAKKKKYYLPAFLERVKADSGHVIMAVASPGAALARPKGKGSTYVQMARLLPRGLDFIQAIICGNDFVGGCREVHMFDSSLATAASELSTIMREKCAVQSAVVGGSADLWKFGWWPSDVRQRYDDSVRSLCACFSDCHVRVCDGVRELSGVRIADGSGHVAWESRDLVHTAHCRWLDFGYPPPLPPVAFDAAAAEVREDHAKGASADSESRAPIPASIPEAFDKCDASINVAPREHVDPDVNCALQGSLPAGWKEEVDEAGVPFFHYMGGVWTRQRPPALPTGWEARWDPVMQSFYYSCVHNGASVRWERPPVVPLPWHVAWSEDHQAFYYYRDGGACTWDMPLPQGWAAVWIPQDCHYVYVGEAFGIRTLQTPPVVPESWSVLWDPDFETFAFKSPQLGKYNCDCMGVPMVPTESAPDACPAQVPAWRVGWCTFEQSFFWQSQVSGELSYEAPVGGDEDAVGSVQELVDELWRHRLITAEDVVSVAGLKTAKHNYMRAHHPDKGGDSTLEGRALFERHVLYFSRLISLPREEIEGKLAVHTFADAPMYSKGAIRPVAPLPPLCATFARQDNQVNPSTVELSSSGSALPCQRQWGFIALERGERWCMERGLLSQACSAEPTDLPESLQGDGWWLGLSWRQIAKALYVQQILLRQEGWNVSRGAFMQLIEQA